MCLLLFVWKLIATNIIWNWCKKEKRSETGDSTADTLIRSATYCTVHCMKPLCRRPNRYTLCTLYNTILCTVLFQLRSLTLIEYDNPTLLHSNNMCSTQHHPFYHHLFPSLPEKADTRRGGNDEAEQKMNPKSNTTDDYVLFVGEHSLWSEKQ